MTKTYTSLFLLVFLFSTSIFGQVFPYTEAFDSYTINQPLNGNGGLTATSHVLVTAHGVVGNCAEFQMSPTALHDTILSPLIGPLTAYSVTSFYFRAITLVNGVPTIYNMTTGDQAQIVVYDQHFIQSSVQYTINGSQQNTTANYIKVTVAIPSILATNSGWFRIIAGNTSGHTWMLEFDSLVVRDTLVIRPTLTTVSITNSHCRGDSSGAIQISASGATPPYRYHWSNGDTTATITHLPGGVYAVTVTDSLGATSGLSDTITQPQFQLQLDSLTHVNVVCRGTASGSAEIYPSGGTPGYTYLWSTAPAQDSQRVVNVPAGNYSVTVSDSRGCTVTATTQITQPSTGLTAGISATGSNGSNGTATVVVNSGTRPYTYLWTPVSQTGATATGLSPGEYYVIITDSSGCTLTDSVTVSNLIGINDVADNNLKIYPNPASQSVYISLESTAALSVVISDMSGREVMKGQDISGTVNISQLMDGVYVVKVSSLGKTYFKRMVVQR